jgi:hypothetical protein
MGIIRDVEEGDWSELKACYAILSHVSLSDTIFCPKIDFFTILAQITEK